MSIVRITIESIVSFNYPPQVKKLFTTITYKAMQDYLLPQGATVMLRLNSSIVLISFYYLFWLLSNDNLCVLPEKFTLQLGGWLVVVLRL